MSATGTPSTPCLRMNAFCASENLDAFIALRSSQPGNHRGKTLTKNSPVSWSQSRSPNASSGSRSASANEAPQKKDNECWGQANPEQSPPSDILRKRSEKQSREYCSYGPADGPSTLDEA